MIIITFSFFTKPMETSAMFVLLALDQICREQFAALLGILKL